ncbi:MAG: dienelactone hydrolase family protein [Armatimonadia bacterium]
MTRLDTGDLPDLLALRSAAEDSAILTSRQWPAKRRDIIRRLEPLLGEMPAEAPPLRPQVLGQTDEPKYLLQKVEYRVEAGETCRAWLLMPRPLAHRQPAIVCCHQRVERGKDELAGVQGHRQLALAKELAGRGFVCLAPDCLTAGERVYPGRGAFEATPYYEQHPSSSLMGKMLWDHQRALDFLCMLDAVDSDRLGVIGHGLGGQNAIMLAAFDHRVKVAGASCAYAPFAADEKPERWGDYLPGLKGYFERGEHPPFLWVEALALLAPRAFHYTYALEDSVYPAGRAVAEDMLKLGRLYDLLGCRQKFIYHEHPGDHEYPKAAREEAYRLFKAVLQDGRGGQDDKA